MSFLKKYTSFFNENFTCENEAINNLFSKYNEVNKKFITKSRVLGITSFLFVFGLIALSQSFSDFPAVLFFLPLIPYLILTVVFYSPVKEIKKEIKANLKAYPAINAKYKKKKRINFVKSVCAMIILILFAVFVGSVFGSSGDSGCSVCGKPVTSTFRDNKYCEQHYKEAIIVTMDQIGDKV